MKIETNKVLNMWSHKSERTKYSSFVKKEIYHFAWILLRSFLLIGLAYMILYPVFITFSKAFIDRVDMNDSTVVLIPKHFSLEIIKLASELLNYLPSLVVTLLYVSSITVIQTFICLLVGYGFARFDIPLKNLLFMLVIFTVVVPPQLYMGSLYLQFKSFDFLGIIKLISGNPLNLMNQYTPFYLLALTGSGIKNGLFIYIFRQNFRNMPIEFEEAATVDGAGYFRIFWSIMIPNAITTIITVGLFSFVWQYNDSFYAGLILLDPNILSMKYMSIAEIGAQTLKDLGLSDSDIFNPMFIISLKSAAVALVIVPIILVYIFAQRYFIESIERAGIVG